MGKNLPWFYSLRQDHLEHDLCSEEKTWASRWIVVCLHVDLLLLTYPPYSDLMYHEWYLLSFEHQMYYLSYVQHPFCGNIVPNPLLLRCGMRRACWDPRELRSRDHCERVQKSFDACSHAIRDSVYAAKRRVSLGWPSATPPREQPEECRGLALLRSIDTVSHASIRQERLKFWKSAVRGVFLGTCVICCGFRSRETLLDYADHWSLYIRSTALCINTTNHSCAFC